MSDVLELVLGKLDGVRQHGGHWMARCPAHEDGKASLSITAGTDQPVVLHCHAGCERGPDPRRDRAHAGRRSARHARNAPAAASGPRTATRSRSTTTPTRTASCCSRCSAPPTSSSPSASPTRPQESGYRWKLGGTRRVLYRLPKVIDAVADGEFIYIAEGEKDVHALEAPGVTATCNPGGAGKWRPEFAEVLRGRDRDVIADKDEPGQARAGR